MMRRKKERSQVVNTEEMRGCCKGRINATRRHRGITKKALGANQTEKEEQRKQKYNVPTSAAINSPKQMICAFTLIGLVVANLKLRYVILRFLFNTFNWWH